MAHGDARGSSRRDVHRGDARGVPAQTPAQREIGAAPRLGVSVVRGAQEVSPARRLVAHARDGLRVRRHGIQAPFNMSQVPHLHGVVLRAGHNVRAVRREINAQHGFGVASQIQHVGPRARVPKPAVRLEAHRARQASVRVETHVVHRAAVPFLAQELRPRLAVPQAPGLVEAGGGEKRAGRVKRSAAAPTDVAAHLAQKCPGRAPQARHAVRGGGRHEQRG